MAWVALISPAQRITVQSQLLLLRVEVSYASPISASALCIGLAVLAGTFTEVGDLTLPSPCPKLPTAHVLAWDRE